MQAGSVDTQRLQEMFGDVSHPGVLIAIVGFDGSGKTTQIAALEKRFKDVKCEVLTTRQPTDWYRNQDIVQHFHEHGGSRQTARMLALMAAADRLYHVEQIIVPALQRGQTVICDRYVYATFSVFMHRGVDFAFLAAINSGIPRPNFAFYLELSPELLLERLRLRDGKSLKFEERSAERVASIIRVYNEMGGHLTRINGAREPDAVTEEIWQACRPEGLPLA